MRRFAVLLALLLLGSASSVEATDYFANNACSNNGNGARNSVAPADPVCASSPGGAGPFNIGQPCFEAPTSGSDTCYFMNGSGIYTRDVVDGGYRDKSGFYPIHSGSSGNRITIRNYVPAIPGAPHVPILRNCAGYVANECAGATITANGQSHIRIHGFTIIGAAHLHHTQSGAPCVGCVAGWELDGNTFLVGWFGDGNWSFIFLEAHTVPWIHNNLFESMDVSADRDQNQGSAVKLYHTEDGIIEYNTHDGEGFEATGIDDKENGQRNIQRYNYVNNISGGAFQVCIGAVMPYSFCDDNRIYGNIAVNAGSCVSHLGGSGGTDRGTWVWNNTCYNTETFNYTPSDGKLANLEWWNNINHSANSSNTEMYPASQGIPSISDYNVWTSGLGFTYNGVGYASLAAVVAATTLDDNSTTTACTFVSAPTNLRVTGACATMGRVRSGGVFTSTVVPVGAYGVTNCVGYGCEAPTNVK